MNVLSAVATMATMVFIGSASAQTGPQRQADEANRPPGKGSGVIIIPVERQSDPRLFDGCWVRLIDNIDKPAGKEYLTVVGWMTMPEMKTRLGIDWTGKTDALSIGPNAVATVYGEPGFKGTGVILRPNQVVQDIRKDFGFANSIESLKVDCLT